jgi:Rrf2 family transcriptional regulator, iron-sulfur cluster assembly transcription factor
MNLGTKTRYAVMAMVEMAGRGGESPVALAELAESQEINVPYLEQIFRKLKAGGVVKAMRGPGGGYVLARSAEKIRISEIVEAVEESLKMTRCDAHKTSGCMSNKSRCLTHDLWDGLGNHIHDYLAAISLADVCSKKTKKSA